jgi:alpha-beta hydrolase superfamily lysophospholipase
MTPRLLAATLAVVLGAGCATAARKPDAFYDPPTLPAAGPPGEVLRSVADPDGPEGARSLRILYRSTGLKGEPQAVSALVVIPDGPAPAGGRPVVAWAHPTTGVARDCAPSLQPDWRKTIPGLDEMVAAGWVVVATDYPGLGTPGVHPYLVGASEAQAVVDSVRAARLLPGSGAGKRFAAWGHSQGGHAALFTGELATTLAPELELVGVAAAAPATNLNSLIAMDLGTRLGKVLASETLWSWSRTFDTPISAVVYPDAVPVVEKVAAHCIRNPAEGVAAFAEATPLGESFFSKPITAAEPWAGLMRHNSPGGRIPAPVFISQGTVDQTTRPQVTAVYAGGLCARGTLVRYLTLPDEDHFLAAFKSAPEAVAWMAARFQGAPAPDDCKRKG